MLTKVIKETEGAFLLLGVAIYFMSLFRMPKIVVMKIVKLQRDFYGAIQMGTKSQYLL